MRAKFSFDSKIKEISPELYSQIRELVPALPADQAAMQYYWETYTGNVKKLSVLYPGEISIKGLETGAMIDMNDSIEHLAQRIEAMAAKLDRPQIPKESFNSRVNVHVPNFGMMQIQHVKVENDLCTEALQRELEGGWRILAICPQPDQRRPDYVLGRQSPVELA